MNNFTEYTKNITEARKNYDSGSLLSSEITKYLNKVNKSIPKQVQDIIYLTQKYNLLDAQSIDEIKDSNKSNLKKLSDKYNIGLDRLDELWKLLKNIKSGIKLLPQYQTPQERESIELGKLSMDDLTIDLDSAAGRNAVTKMYMPMVYKIVNQYVGKSKLDRQELISAALIGFTNAMNDWRKEDDPDKKKVVFKTYAGFRVKQQILNDINEFGHSLSGTSSYSAKHFGADMLDAISIDGLPKEDDGDFKQDRLASLGEDPDYNLTSSEEKQWNTLYSIIENQFKQRDINIFYRYFGLHGFKREKSKDIARSMGMSEGNIRNSIINKMLLFLKKDRKASEILNSIQDIYNESLMVEMADMSKEEIFETLLNDDMFILLEEINRWNNKNVFVNAINNAVRELNSTDKNEILNILKGDFEYLDSVFKKYRKLIILFLNNMYPQESMNRKSDVSLLEYMEELQNVYKKYKL